MRSHEFGKLLLLVVALFLILVNGIGCILVEDSPAPGCQKYWGLPPMGGCSGKSIINDLKVQPAIECVTIEVNNCNGGVLNVRNRCDQAFVLGGVQIGPSEYAVLDVQGGQRDGYYTLIKSSSNFSRYVTEQDELIKVTGKLGNQQTNVSYVKTKKLCN